MRVAGTFERAGHFISAFQDKLPCLSCESLTKSETVYYERFFNRMSGRGCWIAMVYSTCASCKAASSYSMRPNRLLHQSSNYPMEARLLSYPFEVTTEHIVARVVAASLGCEAGHQLP